MTGVVEGRSSWPSEPKKEVEEEEDRDGSQVNLDVFKNPMGVVVVRVKHLFRNDEVCGQGNQEDGEEKEAVEDGQCGHHGPEHCWLLLCHLLLVTTALL